ncbi:erythropoietin-like [Discoglossus pictus]
MDINRVYLLIILVLCPDMSRMNPRLMCDRHLIQLYVNRTRIMERNVTECPDRSQMLEPITLPNVEVSIAKWQNMTESQQRNEILSDLNILLNSTQSTKTPECISKQIVRLSRSIKEIRGIINKTMKFVKSNSSDSQEIPLPIYTCTLDSTDIFRQFLKLLKGKVSLFMKRLREVSCR